MRSPDEELSTIAAKWFRIGRRIARLERRNEVLGEMVEWQKSRIESLEEELLRVHPTDTKWGWLWWTLKRPEALHVRIKSEEGQSAKYTRCMIYSAMSSAWKHTKFDVSIHHLGGDVWEVSRGRTWKADLESIS